MAKNNFDRKVAEDLKEAALIEFMAKGFEKANLRSICERAKVTTGALYFFYKNKEDLFDKVVEPTIQNVSDEIDFLYAIDGHLDGERLEKLAVFLYENQAGLKLLLCGSQKTKYEDYVDFIYDTAVNVLDKTAKDNNLSEYSPEFKNIIAVSAVTIIKELVSNDYDKETMISLMKKLMYCTSGMIELIVDLKKNETDLKNQ
ncbi:MAG: TetR/AcrR family transcriptional regulator [Clostridia bacterium]|nr:TetR/AcrR family transcriptional regulator [Clostridia bacterium]